MVVPVSAQIRRSSSLSRSRVISSSAPNGSSISRRRGPPSSARAIETRWRMPPDSSCGNEFSQPARPTSSINSRGVAAPDASGRRPPTSSGSSTFFNAVRHGSSAASWNTKPSALALRASSRRRCRAPRSVPPMASIRSATTRSKVDLPQPDGPSRLRKPPRLHRERHVLERRHDAALGHEPHRDIAALDGGSGHRTSVQFIRSWRGSRRSSSGCRAS